MKSNVTVYKVAGEALLIVPIALLIILGVGEISGGIISGIQHFIQLIPLLIVAILCWYFPRWGGEFLIALALVLAVLYYFTSPALTLGKLLTELLLFGLPIAAGTLFFFSVRYK